MKLWIATGNKGKLSEFKLLLNKINLSIHSQNELSVYSSPPETGTTFLENARIKARSLKSVVDDADWVLADDSGLCVEGLGGLPGVHSARYAGEKARDSENVAKLLKMMQIRSATNRKAYFECSLVLLSPQREEHVFTGQVHGQIATAARGTGGFGYDPVFIPDGHQQTFGELTDAVKNSLSHRAVACKKLSEFLVSL
ncbi:RdgB/HAM1 family non-canonical purine NTP pyrophosphatase [bacterium]|nr:RdgB/HAM1 family non-canonical purine NTP pyrophosphatase [bacterium]